MKNDLKRIAVLFKEEYLGNIEHPSEYWGNGEGLKELKTDDPKIKEILYKISEYSYRDYKGEGVSIFEYINGEQCNYIAEFLGLNPLDYESDWTDEEEEIWIN